MQNFKSYLKENNNNFIELKLYLDNTDEKDYSNPELIKRHFPNFKKIENVNRAYDAMWFSINEDIDDNKLKELEDKFFKIFPKRNFLINSRQMAIICNGMPKHTISSRKYSVVFDNVESLSGIHKVILRAEYISFVNENEIKSNVLGLLKIPSLIQIFSDRNISFLPWMKIINKHLDGDRDVIACSEELIENGFKDYAKF